MQITFLSFYLSKKYYFSKFCHNTGIFFLFSATPIKNVYLSNNALTSISSSLLPWKELDTVRLDGNPWHCDCRFSWIVSKDVYNLSAIDYSYLICKSPEHVADLPIVHLSKDNFGCSKYQL